MAGPGAWEWLDGRLHGRVALERQRTLAVVLVVRAVDFADPIDADGGMHGDIGQRVKRRSRYDEMAAHVAPASLGGAAALGLGAWAATRFTGSRAAPALLALAAAALAGKRALAAMYEG